MLHGKECLRASKCVKPYVSNIPIGLIFLACTQDETEANIAYRLICIVLHEFTSLCVIALTVIYSHKQ